MMGVAARTDASPPTRHPIFLDDFRGARRGGGWRGEEQGVTTTNEAFFFFFSPEPHTRRARTHPPFVPMSFLFLIFYFVLFIK